MNRRYILCDAGIRERAAAEVSRLPLADGDKPRLTEAEGAQCDGLLWRYAVEERG